ncbi:hypothetical protein BDR07DRAFT_1473435 [Suillus spraguei]|nr:hypothetical protein BDR07DRAFT_1473435 [Suillus spraguei]
MSLPPATKDISEHPKAGSAAKEADVSRTIHFYRAIKAFLQGRMPDNHQIDEILQYLLKIPLVDENKLSPDGQKLVQDAREIIETARLIVTEKNADELFQSFIWNTRDISLYSVNIDPGVPPLGRAKIDEKTAVCHLRTILSLILTKFEVRKLLSDFSIIGRDILAKEASKVAESLRPGEEELAHIDEAVPQDDETPVLEAKIPGTDTVVERHPRADNATVTTGGGSQKSGKQIVGEGCAAVDDVKDDAKDKVSQAQDTAQEKADQARQQGGIKERIRDYAGGVSERFPQQRNRASEHIERARKFPGRGKVIIECQKHSDYQDAIKWLLGEVERYVSYRQTAAGRGGSAIAQICFDRALSATMSELRTLLERFTDGLSMDDIFDASNALIDDARRDDEFRNWFHRLNTYIHKVLLEAGFVLENDCNREGNQILESGRHFWDEKYKERFDNLFHAIGKWLAAMGEDP